ncbi:MAG: hypothetical protein EB117_12590 [Betaproteobacteria bacterium]|nr:hypothetical protein [Betaproteobacteria bacterium]
MEFNVFVGGSGKKLTDIQKEALAGFGVTLENGAIENKAYALVSKWLDGVIELAKQNLANSKAIASNALSQSIQIAPIALTDKSFVVGIEANGYWKFVDLGVKGANSSSRAPNSPFQYRDKRPPLRPIQEWIAFKSIGQSRICRKLGAVGTGIVEWWRLLSKCIHRSGKRGIDIR